MSERRRILVAALASLLLHLGLVAATWNLDWLGAREPAAAEAAPAPLELVLAPDEEPAATDAPTTYTDVPERQAAEERPERADYLALVDSRAADAAPGGEADAPARAPEAGEIEQVAIRQERLAEAGGLSYPGREAEPTGRPQAGRSLQAAREEPAEAPAAGREVAGGEFPLPTGPAEADRESPDRDRGAGPTGESLPDLVGGAAPSILRPAPRAAGDAGWLFDQLATGDVEGNALLRMPDFRLSTWAWNWAPWMKAFSSELRRHWFAPYAYSLGVIDGRTVVWLVVQRDGTVGQMEVRETVGHESLHRASVAAIRAAAPFAPLPPDFPDERLEITLTLHYPAWKSAASGRSEPSGGRGRGRGRNRR